MRKFLNLAHYFPYDVKLRILAHSRSFIANQKARNAIFGAENLLSSDICPHSSMQTVSYEEQIMSKDKYPSIFSPEMEAIVYLSFKSFSQHAQF